MQITLIARAFAPLTNQSSKPLIRSERLKLLATTLNSVGLAFAIGGFVAPAISGGLSGRSGVVQLSWLALGAGLHLCAQLVLGRLRP